MKFIKKYEWKSYIQFSLYVIAGLFDLWIFLSWINVVMHNSTDCQYWTFNFFNLF